VIVTRDSAMEARVAAGIVDSFGKNERQGIHLSDLLSPRRAFWQRAMPLPPTPEESLYFLAGRGHEDAFGRIAGLTVAEESEWEGIRYRPDFDIYGAPGEFKTRRSNLAAEGEEERVYDNYLAQLRGYCAIYNSTDGWLLVLSLLEGRSNDPLNPTRPVLAVYRVTFTKAELFLERERLRIMREALAASLTSGDPSSLPLCAGWMCGKRTKTMTQQPSCKTCGKVFASEEWGPKQHLAGKSGQGHEIIPAEIAWSYTPKCKWYESCRPQDTDPERS
jgi:hypothetical protein